VIAADSCQADGFGQQTGSCCKIVSVGNFVYVANSFVYHDEPRFDLAAIFKQITTVESLRELVATIGRLVPEPLTSALAYGRTCNKTGFIETFKTRRPLGITIAGIEKGKLASVNLDFQIEDLTASKLRLAIVEKWCPGPGCPENIATNAVAEARYRTRFPKEYPGFWLGNVETVVKSAERFVQNAIDKKIRGVAPPISVLVITTSGFDWRKRGLCRVAKAPHRDSVYSGVSVAEALRPALLPDDGPTRTYSNSKGIIPW
jgi:hypothetical protein